jgi:hypothetical protein
MLAKARGADDADHDSLFMIVKPTTVNDILLTFE